ncbi:MAG: protein kinase [bacterium]
METLEVLNNRYQLLSRIKDGGFGIIYKGYDSVLGKDIAVKEIKPELLGNAWITTQFQNEARRVAKMNHQNIVHIFDLVQGTDDNFYIVMEYIDGLDLSTILRECQKRGEKIPQHFGIHIIAEVCKALDYAHNCSIFENNEQTSLVHQDISPSNIMVSKNGVVKLIDFGIAGVRQKAIAERNYIPLQGKVQYMSPEQVIPNAQFDRRSDLFSLGLVLYEVLEGRRYFLNEDSQKIIEILSNGKLKLKDIKSTPKALLEVLNKALAKSVEQRYQNANQFYIDLVTYLVTNADTARIENEVGGFISKLRRSPEETRKKPYDIGGPDILFDDILQDIHGDHQESSDDVIPSKTNDAFGNIEVIDSQKTTAPQTTPPFNPVPTENFDNTVELLDAGDEIKTVIDLVRLSTRGHKKLMIRISGVLVLLAILFLVVDTFVHWTPLGTDFYDRLFPPAIKISSVPADARVYLNGSALAGTTPLGIDDIKPGIYELKLEVDGYNPIVKSLHVPSKGEIQIKGERTRSGNKPYLFRFKTTLEISSNPQDAEVYINNIKYGQNTPCSITWETGEPFEIELRKPGYPTLAGFTLDTEKMLERIEDRRLWRFESQDNPYGGKIEGLFGKFFVFTSNPPDAFVYLDSDPNPITKTGKQNNIFLTAETHKVVFVKKGYNKKAFTVDVMTTKSHEIFTNLSRPVKFMAYDATNGATEDMKATITKITRKGKTVFRNKRTPAKLNLLSFSYQAFLSKEGYKNTKIKVSPRDKLVVVKMQPINAQFSVVALDAESGQPLSNVEVRYKSLDNPNTPEVLLDITDTEGTASGSLYPGLYLFRTSKSGFDYQEKTIMMQAQGLNLIEFNLTKHK